MGQYTDEQHYTAFVNVDRGGQFEMPVRRDATLREALGEIEREELAFDNQFAPTDWSAFSLRIEGYFAGRYIVPFEWDEPQILDSHTVEGLVAQLAETRRAGLGAASWPNGEEA